MTGTPISSNAAAFKCCSYWFFIGMTNSFFCRYKASAGVSNPAPQRTPEELAILVMKASLLIGRIETFFMSKARELCLLNTCQLISENFIRCFKRCASS
ncbi:hypothetical protein D3C71_2004370 [compost metagenome]